MRIRSFRNEKRNKYYFRVFDTDNLQILRSEAYNSKAARDNGIESFKKNAPTPERYERLTAADGKFYFNIKAANHQVVATSLMFDSEEKRESIIAEIIAYAKGAGGDKTAAAQNLVATKPVNENDGEKTNRVEDEYMDLGFYENSGSDTSSGFDRFQKGDDNAYYFSFKSDDGKVLLFSQAYKQESGRDNGITSVEKNGVIEERYSTHSTEDGKFYFTLKAGNHQEIARSADFDSEEDMNRAMGILMNGGGSMENNKGGGDSKEQDDYMDAGFYEDSGTATTSGFDKFQKGDAGLSYFSFKSDDGKVLLLSQGYTQEAGRDNGIASVEKNGKIEKRYSTHTTEDGKFYFTLKAGNHQEIARSVNFDSEEDMKRAMGIIMQGGGSMVEIATPPKSTKGDGMDDYRTFGFYKDSGTGVENGWDKFYSEKHGEYYFSYKQNGVPVIISEGYTTEAARDNGIASVQKNWGIEKRYKVHETASGRYYYTLRAGNHQEIARSKWFSSADERDGSVSWLMAGGIGAVGLGDVESSSSVEEVEATATPIMETTAIAATTAAITEGATSEEESKTSSEPEDDYLPCKAYEGHDVNDKVNNVAFFKHDNGQFYFVIYKEDGSVRLRSEGFGSAKDRDSELSGLLKNLDNEEMYETIKRGKYSIHILRDKTGREVGRSCLEKEAEEPVAVPVVETATAATAVAAVAVSASSDTAEVEDKDDDYLPCRAYEGHDINDKVNNVAFFKNENGQYYFVVYKEDGSVRLRSEGFKTAKERDVELSGMLKNIDNPDMYETLEKGKYRLHILRDATGREVGRSCLEIVEEEAAAPVIETATAAAVAAAATTAIASETTEEEVDKEDDYLPCKDYEGHKISDKTNNVAFFKKDGQYYFVVYKGDGKTVRLRSEGFRNARERDSELSGALKNLNNADMYETITKGKYSLHILKDESGREVGRSCLETESVGAVITSGAAMAAAAAAAVVANEVTPEIEVEQEEVVPVVVEEPVVVAPPPVVETTAAATASVAETATTAASGGGLGIWKWLIPLLLLAGMLYLMRGCFGCGGKTIDTTSVTPPKVEKPVEKVIPPVVKDTVEKVVEVVTPTCNCTGSSNVIFNIPSSSTPKVLTRLGTNPEFGNSHSLDAAGFYNKLKNAYGSNQRDKRFLDNMFKAMGYSSGFSAANAGMFSSTRVSAGTTGNMGYSNKHRTVYAQLNASGRDLDAFRIKAANGCDIHFMKTCGNHFFFCPN